MRFVGRGHPAIRATHAKTLELTTDTQVSRRGTCIVAVQADVEPRAPYAGPIRIRLTVGEHRFGFRALANSSWDPGGPAVIRRGPLRLPGTFATDAFAAASDLPRELVAALADPDVLVTADVVAEPVGATRVVLFAHDPLAARADPALAAELAVADEVIAADPDAARLTGGDRGAPGGRTLVVATRDLPGDTCPGRLADVSVETVGLPPPLAVAAACPSRLPLVIGDDPDLLRTTPSGHRLVLPVSRAELPALLARAAELRRSGAATVMQDHGRPLAASPDDVPDLDGAGIVACCLHPVVGPDAMDPTVRAAIDALLADSVSTRTAAKALVALTGLRHRDAYSLILDWDRG